MSAPILIATVMRPEGDTGVQTHFRAFMAYLRGRSIETELLTPYSAKLWQVYPAFAVRRLIDPVNKPASVWWYRRWHWYFLRAALRRRLANGQACVIYAQCPLSASAALSARVTPQQRIVAVVHFNVSQADEWAGKGMIPHEGRMFRAIHDLEAHVLPALDGLVFVSRFMQRMVTCRIPAIDRVPYTVVPNFVQDPGLVNSNEIDVDLISVGTLEPRKNQAYLLDILASARQMGRRYTLTLVGDGPNSIALKQRAVRIGVGEQVHFAGYVCEAAALMPQHRAYIHAAQMENLPLTLIEALSHGLPVLAPAIGGIPEIFDDGVEGRYIPLEDPRAAVDCVSALLDDPDACSRAGSAARRRFLANFETSKAAGDLLNFLSGFVEDLQT